MVLGTPANALSWFSRLLSGSAHDYVVSNIGKILGERRRRFTMQSRPQRGYWIHSSLTQTREHEQSNDSGQPVKGIGDLECSTWTGKQLELPYPKNLSAKPNKQEPSSEHYVQV